jgi:ribosomal protein L40E
MVSESGTAPRMPGFLPHGAACRRCGGVSIIEADERGFKTRVCLRCGFRREVPLCETPVIVRHLPLPRRAGVGSDVRR